MTVQLYDLSCAPRDDNNNLTFVMRAPLSVIAKYLNLRREATDRILRETKDTLLPCFLYSKDRPDDVHVVWLPANPLPTTAVR